MGERDRACQRVYECMFVRQQGNKNSSDNRKMSTEAAYICSWVVQMKPTTITTITIKKEKKKQQIKTGLKTNRTSIPKTVHHHTLTSTTANSHTGINV